MKDEKIDIFKSLSNLIISIILILVSIFLGSELGNYKETFAGTGISAAIMPKCIMTCMCVIAILLLIPGIKELKSFIRQYKCRKLDVSLNEECETLVDEDGNPLNISKLRLKLVRSAVPGSILAFSGFIFLFKPLGYVVSACLYMVIQSLLLSLKVKRNYKLIIFVSILAPLLSYLFFANGFGVILPRGILFK